MTITQMGRLKVPKGKRLVYFTKETQMWISKYNEEPDPVIRNLIYEKHIHYAFSKIVEILINKYKYWNFDVPYEDIKAETTTHLMEKMGNLDLEKGKAFSFFSVIARNYLKGRKKKHDKHISIKTSVDQIDNERNIINEIIERDIIEERSEFIDIFVAHMDKYLLELFPKQTDAQIADAITELFRNRRNIENFNKKALYLLIRERTGIKALAITSVIAKIKKIYTELETKHRMGMEVDLRTQKDIIQSEITEEFENLYS